MNLPEGARDRIETDLGRIDRIDSVSGGSITPAFRLSAAGQSYFLKYATNPSPGFFAAEAAGLEQLRRAQSALKVPHVAGRGRLGDAEWLILEWLDPVRGQTLSEELGRGLAALHRQQAAVWGWERDGFIGSLTQSNRRCSGWAEFWWKQRLLPQILLAEGYFQGKAWQEDLPAALDRVLAPAEEEGPSLLHGDLWSGNVMATVDGPAIFDPACYFGHREVDLAMTELFGGFEADFYAAYDEAWRRLPGYSGRRAAYQLYYLLVHVNLFGASYVPRTTDTLRHLLRL